jgi:hypothetical protein
MEGRATVLWAGKRLTSDEEEATRRLVAMLQRNGRYDTAARFERFLPEHEGSWTPDELELGAHAGPWLSVGARAEDSEADEAA